MQNQIGVKFRRIFHMIGRTADNRILKLDIDNTNMQNIRIMMFIKTKNDEEKDVFAKDIENHFCITRSTASKVINLMVKKEYISYEPVEYDARLKKLVLTDLAHSTLKKIKPILDDVESDFLQSLTADEIEILDNILDKIIFQLRKNQQQKEEFPNA